jgi:hypothetical protein
VIVEVGRTNECEMSKINWKLIAFVGLLWWFVYSAPTEDSIIQIFAGTSSASMSDDF